MEPATLGANAFGATAVKVFYGYEIPETIDDILHSAADEYREPENDWCNEYYRWAANDTREKTHRINIDNFRKFGINLISEIRNCIQNAFYSDDVAQALAQDDPDSDLPVSYEAGICNLMALVYEKAGAACLASYIKCCDDLEAWHTQNGSIDDPVEG